MTLVLAAHGKGLAGKHVRHTTATERSEWYETGPFRVEDQQTLPGHCLSQQDRRRCWCSSWFEPSGVLRRAVGSGRER